MLRVSLRALCVDEKCNNDLIGLLVSHSFSKILSTLSAKVSYMFEPTYDLLLKVNPE